MTVTSVVIEATTWLRRSRTPCPDNPNMATTMISSSENPAIARVVRAVRLVGFAASVSFSNRCAVISLLRSGGTLVFSLPFASELPFAGAVWLSVSALPLLFLGLPPAGPRFPRILSRRLSFGGYGSVESRKISENPFQGRARCPRLKAVRANIARMTTATRASSAMISHPGGLPI